jgi:transposase
MRKRRNHDAGFKTRTALEAVKGERTVSVLAPSYTVHPMIQQWKKALHDGAAKIFERGGRKPAEVEEDTVRDLDAKIGEFAVANDLRANRKPNSGTHRCIVSYETSRPRSASSSSTSR